MVVYLINLKLKSLEEQVPEGASLRMMSEEKFLKDEEPDVDHVIVFSCIHPTMVSRWREKFPNQWLIPVVIKSESKAHLTDVWFQSCDDMLMVESWSDELPIALQRYKKFKTLRQERRELKESYAELLKQNKELGKKTEAMLSKIEGNLDLAQEIQKSLSPGFSSQLPGVSILAKFIPGSGRGGDYYDVFEFGDEHRYAILLANGKTHSILSELLSALIKISVKEIGDRFRTASDFLSFLMSEVNAKDNQLSLLVSFLDRKTLALETAAVGGLTPSLWRNKSEVEFSAGKNVWQPHSITFNLQPGDTLVFPTDGLESALENKKTFKKCVNEALMEKGTQSLLSVQNNLLTYIEMGKDKKPIIDDITFVLMHIEVGTLRLA
jgi:serine phosphatase RsbU (regulator of sigma subunit)